MIKDVSKDGDWRAEKWAEVLSIEEDMNGAHQLIFNPSTAKLLLNITRPPRRKVALPRTLRSFATAPTSSRAGPFVWHTDGAHQLEP